MGPLCSAATSFNGAGRGRLRGGEGVVKGRRGGGEGWKVKCELRKGCKERRQIVWGC